MNQLLLATILVVAMLSIASIVTSSVALAQNMSGGGTEGVSPNVTD